MDLELFNAGDPLVEVRVELGERLLEWGQFLSWSVNLEAVELGKGKGLFDLSTDVFEVGENSGGPDIGFTTEDLITADGEIVVKAGVLSGGAGDEVLHQGFEVVEFSFLDFEIRMNADCLRELAHGSNLPGDARLDKAEKSPTREKAKLFGIESNEDPSDLWDT